jgi:hypothetical protein
MRGDDRLRAVAVDDMAFVAIAFTILFASRRVFGVFGIFGHGGSSSGPPCKLFQGGILALEC